jgi:hypothetical protein
VNAVYKYELHPDTSVVSMPEGARILHVDVQDNRPYIWALVDPTLRHVGRKFAVVGTGQQFDATDVVHVGTFLMYGGDLVWHVFEHVVGGTQ